MTDLGFVARGKSKHRPRNDKSLFGGDYPFIQTGKVKSANFYLNTYSETYNEKGLAQSKLWNKGTLLITIAANIAETAILDIQACFPDSIIGFIPFENKSDVRFIKYYLDYIKKKLQVISQGTTQDNMSVEKLTAMPLYVPDYNVQIKIANILSNYDNLIENNTKRIKLLEEMAEELYKEWFVRLRFPNYENTKIVDGIPEGWRKVSLKDISELIMGQSPESKYYNDNGEGLPFYQGVTNFGYRFPKNEVWSTQGFRVAKAGDILFSVRAPVGRLNIANQAIILGRGLSSIRHKLEWNSFLFYQLKNIFFEDNIIGNGAIFDSVTKSDVENITLITDDTVSKQFDLIAKSIDKEIEVLSVKNQNLKETRDLLLPRLLSGKLNIEDLEIV